MLFRSSITFAGIPQSGYQHLQIRYIARDTSATVDENSLTLQFNGDTTANYNRHYLLGDGATVFAGASTPSSIDAGLVVGGGLGANCFAAGVIDILDYTNTTKNKTVRSLSGGDTNAGTNKNYVEFESGLWRSTAAINSILVQCNGGNLEIGRAHV